MLLRVDSVMWELLEVVLEVLLGVIITSLDVINGNVGAVEDGNIATAEVRRRRHQMPEVDLGITSDYSRNVLVVIVEVAESLMTFV